MKNMAICLLIISAFSCTKQQSSVEETIHGNWELRKLEGGVTGLIIYQSGNGHIYEFKDNSTFRYVDNGTVTETGTYTLQPSPTPGQLKLVLNGTTTRTVQVKIAAQQLIFLNATSCCDNPDVTFEKL
jgi:hypothetical protein